jgi:osmotically-inducible protein OsmY
MRTFRGGLRWLGFGVLLLTGCVRQDTEILVRVGRKLADKAQSSTTDLREKLPFRLTTVGAPPSLSHQVQQRFASDKILADIKFEVHVRGAEVELKGVVEKEEQKLRAFDLTETTRGVEKVIDSVQVRDSQ